MIILKKIVLFIICLFMIFPMVTKAMDAPFFDGTFDNGRGAFFANGTPIIIKEIGGDTIITWDAGSQVITENTMIFGGGTENKVYETSNITMESGTVSVIYGGGMSLDASGISTVGTANILIKGGNIQTGLYGGGLLYTTTTNTFITIDGGNINAVCGGGIASATISGVTYSAGTEEAPENSLNRVENASIVMNSGTIDATNLGAIFGGGQGYSYVGNANVTINGGDLSDAYVILSGSNGYTGSANATINGGNIYVLQTVNRGVLEEAKVQVNGGNIEKMYVGGETEDPGVTGIVEKVEMDILGGTVNNLSAGTSGGVPLVIDKDLYNVVSAEGTVVNNEIASDTVSIAYTFDVVGEFMRMYEDESEKLYVKITTIPTGYEDLFMSEKITWSSSDEEVAVVNDEGIVEAKGEGVAVIEAQLLSEVDTVEVEVENVLPIYFMFIVLAIIICIIIFGILLGMY